jgi:hypothetical protein
VAYVPLESALAAAGYASADAFNEELKIHRAYRFLPKAGEAPGRRISALSVLSVYSDEPDWGMDQRLFDADQHPGLWRSEYAMMGGKEGLPSQSFRHMYWGGWRPSAPLASFKIPRVLAPMGEAPARAAVFLELARKMKARGQRYWELRFAANALHYLQDLTQPFHASQTPSKRVFLMPLLDEQGSGFRAYVLQAQHILTYLHFSFEYVADRILEEGERAPSAESEALLAQLSRPTATSAEVSRVGKDPVGLGTLLARLAADEAPVAGGVSLELFPRIRERYEEVEPTALLTSEWWRDVMARIHGENREKREYLESVGKMYALLGQATRETVAGSVQVTGTTK